MKRLYNSALGFSLIELLIVISIMMTVLGLVGSSAVTSLEKAEAQTELISAYTLIKKTGFQAFASGSGTTLIFSENSIFRTQATKREHLRSFKYLYFDPQRIIFNRNGLPNVFQLVINIRGVAKEVDLKELFSAEAISDGGSGGL